MSPWLWLVWAVVLCMVVGLGVFIASAIWGAIREAQRADVAGKACPRCGHPWGEPWGVPDHLGDEATP